MASRNGYHPRLELGIPVPFPGFEHKVFMFGSMHQSAMFPSPLNIRRLEILVEKPTEVELFQFVGRIISCSHHDVPSTQLATGENWTMLHHMSSSEYLNYETVNSANPRE